MKWLLLLLLLLRYDCLNMRRFPSPIASRCGSFYSSLSRSSFFLSFLRPSHPEDLYRVINLARHTHTKKGRLIFVKPRLPLRIARRSSSSFFAWQLQTQCRFHYQPYRRMIWCRFLVKLIVVTWLSFAVLVCVA